MIKFDPILRELVVNQVEFIIVGGVAAAFHGAPLQTFDIDIVHLRSEENVAKLLGALSALGAVFRMQPERRLEPNRSHLLAGGHVLLLTRFGPLDVLGTIGSGYSYTELLPDSREFRLADGLSVRVLNLDRIIAVKEETAGEKDRLALPVLRRVLEESRKQKKGRPEAPPG